MGSAFRKMWNLSRKISLDDYKILSFKTTRIKNIYFLLMSLLFLKHSSHTVLPNGTALPHKTHLLCSTLLKPTTISWFFVIHLKIRLSLWTLTILFPQLVNTVRKWKVQQAYKMFCLNKIRAILFTNYAKILK